MAAFVLDAPNVVGNAIGYARHYRRPADTVIRVHDEAGYVIGTDEHVGDFRVV